MNENENAMDPVIPNLEFDLDRHIVSLLQSEPFFAEISRHVEKRATTALQTAGVRMTGDAQFELLYNPEFFAKLPTNHRIGVLKHEFYHLVLGHVTDRLPGGKMSKRWNVATDLAINSHIPSELPEFCLFPGKGHFKDLRACEAAEWYYNNLPTPPENSGGEPSEDDSFDDHNGWGAEKEGEGDNIVREMAKQRLREMMRGAADTANRSSNGWGSVSSALRQEIMNRISGKIDWRAVLRYFVKTSTRANKTSTVRRLNKRYAYIHPGQKVQRHAKIAISIDQSGSVGDDMLEAFFAELNNLAKVATFTVVPFDTEVAEDMVYVWKKGTNHPKERVRCGGTDFTAPTKYVNDRNFDGHIVLTDMQAPQPINSRCQRMWMTTRACKDSMPFKTHERVIPVD